MAKKKICVRGHMRTSDNLFKGGACKLCEKLRDRRGDLNYKKYQEKYRAIHRKELNIQERVRYKEKREEILFKARERYALNPEPARLQAKRWAENNQDRKRRTDKAWVRSHPDNHKATVHRRRTRKTNAGGSFTAEEWANLKRKYRYRCLGCNRRKPLEADHVVPVVHGGTSFISNIQPLCRSCNAKKNDKHIDYR